MENRLKLRISRIFRSSLASCRSKHISDTAEQPFFFPQNPHHHHQLIELFSPKPPSRPFPSICRPKSSHTPEIQNTHLFPRSKVTDRSSILPFPAEKNPPASPISPVKSFHDFNTKPKQRKSRKSRRKKTNSRNPKFDEFFSSVAGNYNGWYSSSEDENEGKDFDDETTFFSSKSMSSDSSEYFGRNRAKKMQGKIESKIESDGQKGNLIMPPLEGKVKDSFAVVKRSSDPYNDFRTSMVEMIVERQIFGTKDLENLLQCFLSLNSICHHKVIIEVYMEIWEALFSDWA